MCKWARECNVLVNRIIGMMFLYRMCIYCLARPSPSKTWTLLLVIFVYQRKKCHFRCLRHYAPITESLQLVLLVSERMRWSMMRHSGCYVIIAHVCLFIDIFTSVLFQIVNTPATNAVTISPINRVKVTKLSRTMWVHFCPQNDWHSIVCYAFVFLFLSGFVTCGKKRMPKYQVYVHWKTIENCWCWLLSA